jgi:glycosyltransferase involved in cell wall biosynthesis
MMTWANSLRVAFVDAVLSGARSIRIVRDGRDMEHGASEIRVLALITSLGIGGAERQLCSVTEALITRGLQVNIVTMLEPVSQSAQFTPAGVPVTALHMTKGQLSIRSLREAVRTTKEIKPHVILSFNYPANVLGRLLGAVCRVPVVITSLQNTFFGGIHRDIVLRLTDCLTTLNVPNSNCGARALIRRRVAARSKTVVIWNGIDVVQWNRDARIPGDSANDPRREPGAFHWMAVGRLEPQKDYSTLLAACQILGKGTTSFRLWIAGSGPLNDQLREELRRRSLEAIVKFIGRRSDIPSLLARSDAFVLSSAWEGSPNVVLEAMTVGLPVVATAVGGVPELIKQNETGYLVPPQEPESLANAMLEMMSRSTEQRLQMGEAARARVEAHYSLEVVVDRWESLIRSAVGNK